MLLESRGDRQMERFCADPEVSLQEPEQKSAAHDPQVPFQTAHGSSPVASSQQNPAGSLRSQFGELPKSLSSESWQNWEQNRILLTLGPSLFIA